MYYHGWIHLTLKVERWRQALRSCYQKRPAIREKAFEIQIPFLYGTIVLYYFYVPIYIRKIHVPYNVLR